MKTICHPILATLVLLLVNAPSTEASLYQTSDPYFGPNSVTVDTSTGLGWLNLSEAAGLSYDQVLSETQAGGKFSGFRFATVPEVLQLYNSAGLTPSAYGDTAHYYAATSPLIQSFFSLIGTTGIENGLPGMIALSGTSPDGGGLYDSPSVYGWSSAQQYWVNNGLGVGATEYGATFSDPFLSSWLVKEVPEPTTLTLLLAGGFILFGQARARGQKLRAES